jgi:hypothetical protein
MKRLNTWRVYVRIFGRSVHLAVTGTKRAGDATKPSRAIRTRCVPKSIGLDRKAGEMATNAGTPVRKRRSGFR